MATSFVQLGNNDSLDVVIRKCNANFRALSVDQEKNTGTSIRRESQNTNAKIDKINEEIASALFELSEATNDSIETIQQSLDQAKQELNQAIKKSYPPINSYLLCETNPGLAYTGTTWTKLGDTKLAYENAGAIAQITVPVWKRTK